MRLTSRNVPTLGPGEYRDDLVPGLLLRVWDTGAGWAFRYTIHGHRGRVSLGPLERDRSKLAEDIERARNLARLLVSGIVKGEDPRIALRRHAAGALSVAALCLQMIEGADLRDRTRRDWRNIYKRHIEETPFGAIVASLLGPDAIDAACAKVLAVSGGVSANRFFEVIRRAFSFGVERRAILASPFVGLKPPFRGEKRRGRYLSAEELARLMNALDQMPPCGYADATRSSALRPKAAQMAANVSIPTIAAIASWRSSLGFFEVTSRSIRTFLNRVFTHAAPILYRGIHDEGSTQ